MFTLKEVFEISVPTKRPVLTLRIPNNNNYDNKVNEGAIKIRKCLFGKCNPDDTLRLLDEQKEVDRKRILERFGIDVNAIENANDENRSSQNSRKPNECSLRKPSKENRKRKLLKKQPSKKVTDFYKLKKMCIQEKENKP